jgi:glucose/arabinose dehydrogenase
MLGKDAARSRALLAIAATTITALLAPTTAGAIERIAPAPFGGAAAESLVAAAAVPTGFEESTAFSGLTAPMAVRFASDGRVFVAEKSGLIKTFDGLADTTPTVFADLRTQVHDFWDRGLTGLELDPNFAANGRVYVLYTRNEEPFSTTMPRWPDGCPTPPGATGDGCVVTGTLSRLDASGNETRLIQKDWCQQYPSHSVGGIAFGADGMLYLSAGDGASFNFADYGQDGSPVNPCGDPPGGVGGAMTAPTAEGGALRSQDVRTSGDPTGLDGAILRLDPNTGAAAPGNPASASADPNTRRIVAHGLRNPFRMTVRPGTNEIWAGDVGWNTWEEIDRVVNPTAGVANFGWPCYEGSARMPAYDNLNVNICENLYAAGGGAHAQPYYAYNHGERVVAGETCPTGGSAIAGLDFYTTGPYPDAYDGALFFADYTRDCIWVMFRGANGLPDPATRQTFVPGAANPVDVQIGPDGSLYYVDLNGGTIRRVRSLNAGPTARASATPTSGAAPLSVSFDGSSSSDPDPGDTLTYAWDLDGDGAFDDSTAAQPSFTYTTAGTYTAALRVTDGAGESDTATVRITAGVPPTATIATPTAGTTWQVGSVLSFSGTARDAQDNTIPASGLSWRWNLRHCSRLDPSNCHTHTIQTLDGVASGSFTAPDHEYPSHLELELTATDGAGLRTTVTRRLDPRTVNLTFESAPAGLQLAVGSDSVTAPATRTVIVGSSNSIGAPSPQTLAGVQYAFTAWSDGGAASHNITAPATATTYRATFAASGPSGLVAAYGFDEGAGGTTGDASGRGNAGTIGGASWTAAGRFGSALSFDGVNDQVTIPDASSLDLTTGMTLEAWVNPSAGGGWRTVLLKERASGLAYALYSSSDGGVPRGYAQVGGDRDVSGTAALPASTWTHLATSYDGSMLRMYVNGTQVATRALTGAIATSTEALKIGGNSVWGEWFAGRIDEVRVYTRALSAGEVQADMATPVGPQGDPVLGVSPESLSFTATAGGADPAPKQLTVAGGTFGFTAAAAPSWLSVTPASGSAPGTVTVAPRIAGLAPGSYQGTVTVTASGVQGSPRQIPVTLRVDPATPPPTGGLVAAYGFNEGSGTAVADAAGRDNDGTVSGASWTAAGRFGSALTFDGVNDMVTIPDAAPLDLTTAMTLEAWVRPSVGGDWRTVLLKGHASGLAYALYASGDNGRPAGYVRVGDERDARGTAALPTGTWTHLAVTYGGGFLRLYVNGVQVGSRAQTGTIATSDLPLQIGGNSVWGEWFAGVIDEVRVYDRALSAAEVQADMAAGV